MTTTALRISGLSVRHGSTEALSDVSIALGQGEVMAVLGASGSGKTTMLHTVAGLLEPMSGSIAIGEHVVVGGRNWVPPEDRRIGLVFQGGALWPHLSVLDTVAYPIRRRGRSRAEARFEASSFLERLGLAALAGRLPAQLSGGEQQRVGLARALACDPELFLFDEPTAHLDTHLRAVVLEEVARRREALGAAALYATHDASEALAIADRIAVLRAGRLVQVGTPQELYEQPVDEETAWLTGPACFIDAEVLPGTVGREAARQVLVRPDWVSLDGGLPGVVESVRFRGPHTDHVVSWVGGQLLVSLPGPPRRRVGERVGFTVLQSWPMAGVTGVGGSVGVPVQREKAGTDA